MGIRKDVSVHLAESKTPDEEIVVGPLLIYERFTGTFLLAEGRNLRQVTPQWINDELHIGCTTITRDAFEKLREFKP